MADRGQLTQDLADAVGALSKKAAEQGVAGNAVAYAQAAQAVAEAFKLLALMVPAE